MRYLSDSGVSRCALARISGLSYKTVGRMCRSNRAGSLDSWMRVADALDAGLDEITGRSDER